jgi:hypothetical protein
MNFTENMFSSEFNRGRKYGAEQSAKEIEELKRRVTILELKDMPMHPLHTREWLKDALDNGYSLREITTRRTGRSTVQALRGIAWVIEHPGMVLRIQDHFGSTPADRNLMNMMCGMVGELGLKHIHFNHADITAVFENREAK